jgi:hypothetical protein
MREKSQWSPASIALWLIAAIVATLILCDGADPKPGPSGAPGGVDLDFEIVE